MCCLCLCTNMLLPHGICFVSIFQLMKLCIKSAKSVCKFYTTKINIAWYCQNYSFLTSEKKYIIAPFMINLWSVCCEFNEWFIFIVIFLKYAHFLDWSCFKRCECALGLIINLLSPVRFYLIFTSIVKPLFVIDDRGILWNSIRWMSLHLTDDKSMQIMASWNQTPEPLPFASVGPIYCHHMVSQGHINSSHWFLEKHPPFCRKKMNLSEQVKNHHIVPQGHNEVHLHKLKVETCVPHYLLKPTVVLNHRSFQLWKFSWNFLK